MIIIFLIFLAVIAVDIAICEKKPGFAWILPLITMCYFAYKFIMIVNSKYQYYADLLPSTMLMICVCGIWILYTKKNKKKSDLAR